MGLSMKSNRNGHSSLSLLHGKSGWILICCTAAVCISIGALIYVIQSEANKSRDRLKEVATDAANNAVQETISETLDSPEAMAEAVSQTIEEAVGDTQQFASSVFAEIKDILNSSNSGDAKESQGSDSRDIKPADGSGSAEDRGTGLVGTLFSLGHPLAHQVGRSNHKTVICYPFLL